MEQRRGATQELEALFGRCLLKVPSIPLWSFYLSYIRHKNSVPQIPPEELSQAKSTIIQAYEFALQNVGLDRDSGSIWLDYIQFIRSGTVRLSLT